MGRRMSRPADDGGSSTLDVYPDDLHNVGLQFAGGQDRIDTIASTLNSALQNAGGMAGDDEYGRNFGAKYDPAAKALFAALSAAVRAIGQAATGLVTTANNYLLADYHSNAHASRSGGPEQYPLPPVFTDIMYPDPNSAIGAGHSSVPHVIAKYWPNGHQDTLRAAASAYRTASGDISTLGTNLHLQVLSITDATSDDSVKAMAAFWGKIWQDGDTGGKAPLSTAKHACDQLAKACDSFAEAIDHAHSSTEDKLAGAGIAIGLTTAVGVLLTVFTFGGSDAAAGGLDAAEAAAILGDVEVTLDSTVATISADTIADVEASLSTAAESVPDIEVVDAETTQVSQELDRELAETEAREPGATRAPEEGAGPSDGPARDALVKELQDNGVKCDPSKIVRIERGADGKIRFLERGNGRAGLQHIVERHAEDFANKGVPEGDIPDVVMRAVTEGKQVGMQGTRPIYETTYQGQPLKIAVTVGDNGFIVGANPAS
ncbi:WXG100-like domain-containing protein [Actinacidiphila acididurans]|uniref:Outer membrane channel protein CpnT-like N-terminal domain-containing protein n=1 Tax=Actinacidiphila acididurans TaxID=2784346 RepID=A0ABS2TYW5_9ACTN|nr:hypothetical protein [Actinacidiphila acididurans]MBM9508524.1 hypothetical protein [Actinacidiphila acididurans]